MSAQIYLEDGKGNVADELGNVPSVKMAVGDKPPPDNTTNIGQSANVAPLQPQIPNNGQSKGLLPIEPTEDNLKDFPQSMDPQQPELTEKNNSILVSDSNPDVSNQYRYMDTSFSEKENEVINQVSIDLMSEPNVDNVTNTQHDTNINIPGPECEITSSIGIGLISEPRVDDGIKVQQNINLISSGPESDKTIQDGNNISSELKTKEITNLEEFIAMKSLTSEAITTEQEKKASTSDPKKNKKFYKKYDGLFRKKFYNLIFKKKLTAGKAADILGIARRTAYNWSKNEVLQDKFPKRVRVIRGSAKKKAEGDAEDGTGEVQEDTVFGPQEKKVGYQKHDAALKKKFFNLVNKKELTAGKASDVLGIARRTAYNWYKKSKEDPEEAEKRKNERKRGRASKLGQEHQIFMEKFFLENPSATLNEVIKSLSEKFPEVKVSQTTVYNFIVDRCGLTLKKFHFNPKRRKHPKKVTELLPPVQI